MYLFAMIFAIVAAFQLQKGQGTFSRGRAFVI